MDKLQRSEIVIIASGAILLIFSFVDWYGIGDFGDNAWDLFPLLTWPAILGTICAAVVAAGKLGNAKFPAEVAGFTWPQLYVIAGFVSVLITVGFMIANDADNKLGLFLSLLGSIGLLVGGVMARTETGGPRTY